MCRSTASLVCRSRAPVDTWGRHHDSQVRLASLWRLLQLPERGHMLGAVAVERRPCGAAACRLHCRPLLPPPLPPTPAVLAPPLSFGTCSSCEPGQPCPACQARACWSCCASATSPRARPCRCQARRPSPMLRRALKRAPRRCMRWSMQWRQAHWRRRHAQRRRADASLLGPPTPTASMCMRRTRLSRSCRCVTRRAGATGAAGCCGQQRSKCSGCRVGGRCAKQAVAAVWPALQHHMSLTHPPAGDPRHPDQH